MPPEPIVHRYLDSFAELCECRDAQLEGLYLGLWYRAAVTGADENRAHLVYLDSEDTEVLGRADFERGSWRVRGGGRGDEEARSSALSPQEEHGEGGASGTAAGRSDLHGAVGRGPSRNTDDAGWEAQLARLAAYKAARGDCNVPNRWATDPRLATWVKKQRAIKRRLDRGEPSPGMTAERAARAHNGLRVNGSKPTGGPVMAATDVGVLGPLQCDIEKQLLNARKLNGAKRLSKISPRRGVAPARSPARLPCSFCPAAHAPASWLDAFASACAVRRSDHLLPPEICQLTLAA
jgi:hypothetical protein